MQPSQNVSALPHRFQQTASQQELKQLQDRNFALVRENSDLKSRALKGGEDRTSVKTQ
jgi:cell division protein FtsB